ncbi:MAG: 4-alpha-glucanotransferase [Ghiorsea sp.]
MKATMYSWIDKRRSAVLLHITSLPGPFHKGVLGKEAFQFIDSLISGGFSVWQFLPLGPTHGHGSPYESLSTFAGNPELLDLRDCVAQGWLEAGALHASLSSEEHASNRKLASQAFWQALSEKPKLEAELEIFKAGHAYWLEDFSLFSALKDATNNLAWWQWEEPLRDRDAVALQEATGQYQPMIQQVIFEQFLFNRQWQTLKTYAEDKGVQLFGDLPIYVAHDSADVWANREYFTVNEIGVCTEVAGVPPDYFSTTGQRWGNPLYHWDNLEASGFTWWVNRVRHQFQRMHMLRIDHFRALEAFWVIPGESEDGIIGTWREAPGDKLLAALKESLGSLPLIAEDLGIITDEVTALRESYKLPGMKILQFAFGGGDDNPYLPHNHELNSVVYTGTHDNDTTQGWFDGLVEQQDQQHVVQHILSVLDAKAEDMPWPLIEAAFASPALLCVIPVQDILELGSEAKFNTPGTLEGNWSWRLDNIPPLDTPCWKHLKNLNIKYQR